MVNSQDGNRIVYFGPGDRNTFGFVPRINKDLPDALKAILTIHFVQCLTVNVLEDGNPPDEGLSDFVDPDDGLVTSDT